MCNANLNEKIKLCVIVGPTASGKTKFAIELAKKRNGEIISADSMQIYKGMDIVTAKPSEEEQNQVKHHLIDFLPPEQIFSVAQFAKLAHEKILEIKNKGKLPILVGGTGLYINSVIDDINFAKQDSTKKIRNELLLKTEKIGLDAMFEKLKNIDYEYAKKISSNDKKRVLRAIEVYKLTGKTMTEIIKNSKPKENRYDLEMIGLNFKDREKLYNRINLRVDSMIADGLVEEAKKFYKKNLSNTAKYAIGYKELFDYLDGKCTLTEAIDKIKQNTRRYAKRQITWFKRDNRIKWIYMDL